MTNQEDLNEAQRPGEIAQWMTALAVLLEFWSLVNYTYTVGSTTTCKSISRGSDNLFWPPLAAAIMCIYTHAYKHRIIKMKIKSLNQAQDATMHNM